MLAIGQPWTNRRQVRAVVADASDDFVYTSLMLLPEALQGRYAYKVGLFAANSFLFLFIINHCINHVEQ
jgi:hypothetical protein